MRFNLNGASQEHVEFVTVDGLKSRVEFSLDSRFHGQVIVDDGTERRHYFPGRRQLLVQPSAQEEASARLIARVLKNDGRGFRLTDDFGGVIAGRETRAVSIFRPNGQLAQTLWIEPRSGVVLKREAYGAGGRLTGFFEYTRFDPNAPIVDADFVLNPAGAMVVTPETLLRRLQSANGLRHRELGKQGGFRLLSSRRIDSVSVVIVQQVYVSHGGRLTLQQGKLKLSDDVLRKNAPAHVNTFTWEDGGESFTLVGAFPQARLRRLAQSLIDLPREPSPRL